MSKEMKTVNAEPKTRRRYNPFYFLLDAMRNLWRQRIISIASIVVLTSCLILLGAFALLIRNIDVNLDNLGLLNEIVVFIDKDATPEEVIKIGEEIKELENVSYVELVSKEEGFEEMRDVYSDYSDLFDKIMESGDNPLADSYVITYKDNAGVNKLEYSLEHEIDGITSVKNRHDYAVTVENIKNGVSLVFIWFFILLFAVSIFVIFNTIKLAVHGRRQEISIMRFIGATNSYIVAPFIIEGAFIGVLSALLAFGADAGVYAYIYKNFGEGGKIFTVIPFSDMSFLLIITFLAIGIIAGTFASIISIRKNLNS